ncbi:MAG: hypothetical protein ACE3L7_26260 [Candidatus Pristimantibacillus sp.]
MSISYENEIVIHLSNSNITLANMTGKKIEIDGKSYTFYTDGNNNYLYDKIGISYLLSTEKESDVAMIEHFLVEMDDKVIAEKTTDENIDEQTTETEVINDFALRVKDTFVNLKDWDHEVNLDEVFGTPILQEVEVLGDGADTLTGSFIKKIKYDGLQLELFSPKNNGKEFMIMTMEITKRGYKTSKGVEIGHTVDEVKAVYPSVQMVLDGKTTDANNSTYVINEEYDFLQMEVKDGLVNRIIIYHLIP